MTAILTAIVTSVPWWIRLTLALVFLLLGVVVFLADSMRAGLVFGVIGFVLLLFSGRSDSEKNGYNF